MTSSADGMDARGSSVHSQRGWGQLPPRWGRTLPLLPDVDQKTSEKSLPLLVFHSADPPYEGFFVKGMLSQTVAKRQ